MLTTAGLDIKTLDELREDLENAIVSTFGPNSNVSADSVFGQIIGVFSAELDLVWQLAQQLYDSFDPDQAFGSQLDNLAALVGVSRLAATSSTVDLYLTGDDGTLIFAGSVVESGDSGDRFETTAEVTIADVELTTGSLTFSDNDPNADTIVRSIGSWLDDGVAPGTIVTISGSGSNDGEKEVEFVTDSTLTLASGETLTNEGPVGATATIGRAIVTASAEETGPTAAPAHTLQDIVTPIDGWDAVTNVEDALVGNDAETDADLRVRREGSLQIRGAAVDNAIRANLLQIDEVEQALVISNRSSVTVNGIPPHAFETVIHPDTGDPDFQELIAETIFSLQPAGIEAFGSSVFNVTDSQNFTQQVAYSFATEIDMWVEIDLTVNSDYPADGDAQVAAAALAEGNSLSVGDDVLIWKFVAALDPIPGIETVVVRIEDVSSPANTANIAIDFRSIAVFDSGRITVTS